MELGKFIFREFPSTGWCRSGPKTLLRRTDIRGSAYVITYFTHIAASWFMHRNWCHLLHRR